MGVRLFDGEWQLLSQTPYERKWIMAVDENNFVVKKETLAHSLTAEANAEDLKASEGRKWGDGQVAARIPLDIWFRDILPAKQAHDDAYVKAYLNRPENAWMRTFKGTL
jgi:hypothetical protein